MERLPGQLLLEPDALGDVARVEDDAADLPVAAQVGDVRLEVAPLAEPVRSRKSTRAGVAVARSRA